MTRYSHAFTLAFEISSNTKDGSDITPEQIAAAVQQQIKQALAAGSIVPDIFDTMPVSCE